MFRARDQVENEQWLAALDRIGDRLDLGGPARSRAADLFLSTLPESERSKQATLAASVYVGALIEGDRRSQGDVADAAEVSRLTIQKRWKELIEEAGLRRPNW
ncbi:transcription initiation factor IIB family protein [Halomarina pelagica]|uniref:transcription initiation factor IIB family protein n=1 Tax=Halomarina pelagica TaxID=2961599 RepID=UPI0020C43379|nr:transcription initiation factor IIB family protein [Halomarina sp. BND7]